MRRHFRLTLTYAVGARHGEPVAGYSSTGGLRDAHARPLRRQPAGRPGTGKNAGKDEEDRNHEIAALPTFSNRQDQYTFRSPVTDLNRSGWHCCNLLILHSLKAYTKQGPFPQRRVVLSQHLKQYYEPLRLPTGLAATSASPYTHQSMVCATTLPGLPSCTINLPLHAIPGTPMESVNRFRYPLSQTMAFPVVPAGRLPW